LEVGSAWSNAGALEIEDGLCIRTRSGEHGPSAARCKSRAKRRLVGRREASERFAKVIGLAGRPTKHSRAQGSCAQRTLPTRGDAR
jgi:hypothetical protein